METQANEATHLQILTAGVAALLIGSAGIVAVLAWLPSVIDMPGLELALDKFPALPNANAQPLPAREDDGARVNTTCPECGVVASTREIDPFVAGTYPVIASGAPPSAKSHEVTVRMSDGSNHVFTDATHAVWRPGERVILIQGAGR